ncbi:MAG: hypothetical protein FJ224_10375 [Lentisphaerae bacterium]|nr:hypothetical protein [Lentisphaerota bacterium]
MSRKDATLSTPVEILERALEKERQAFEFYSGLLEQSRVRMVQDLVATLKDEEQKHVRMIEQKLAEIRRG